MNIFYSSPRKNCATFSNPNRIIELVLAQIVATRKKHKTG